MGHGFLVLRYFAFRLAVIFDVVFPELRKSSGRRRRNENSAAGGAKFSGKLFSRNPEVKAIQPEISTCFLRRRPRAFGAGPAPLVLLRGSGNLRLPVVNDTGPALFPCAVSQAPAGLASRLHKPAASCGQRPSRALSCSALREPWRSRSGAP